jgi:hypothetical protein
MTEADLETISTAGNEAREVLRDFIAELGAQQVANGKFFPNGIERIDVELDVGPADKPLFHVKVLVEGPKPTQDELDEGFVIEA